MSYQALARKWRPRTFAELSGQEHVVRALTNALTRNRLHHAYLLTGTRGVGKTTIARILAKSLNCDTGITATPCGVCPSCADIDAGRFVDLLELDAASNTGIDNMREILDNARYAPTTGRYKVYLIDEVHMLSKAAFNSMLKTLEEPPEHVKFVLATTDPQKIPVTVLSRCLQFNLKQLPAAAIVERLGAILAAETIAADQGALTLIARGARGSMRDALSLLDQAIAYGDGEVREEVVRTMLGAVDTQYVFGLADALLAGDGEALLAQADAMTMRNLSGAAALEELASLFHRIAVAQTVPAAAATLEDSARVAAYAARISPEQVQLAYQICVQGRADLALAPDEAMGFSMTLLRLLAFEPGAAATPGGAGRDAAPPVVRRQDAPSAPTPIGAPAARAAARNSSAGSALIAAPSLTSTRPPSSSLSKNAPASPQATAVPAASGPNAVPAASGPTAVPAASAPNAVPAASGSSVASAANQEPQAAAAVPTGPAEWIALMAGLRLSGMLGQLAAQTEWRRCDGREIVLAIPEAQRHLTDRVYAEKLRAAIDSATGHKTRLTFEYTAEGEASLAAQERRERAEKKARTEAAFRDEPFVRDVLARFDARVKPDSIKPAS